MYEQCSAIKIPRQQRGVVLAVGLILLLVMTLVMLVAMSGSILQERMAGAMRNESIADVGADSALRDGELWVWKQIVQAGGQLNLSSTSFPLRPDSSTARNFRSGYAWVSGGNQYGSAGSGISFPTSDYYKMAQTPVYLVEGLGEVGETGEDPEAHQGNQGTLNESLHYYRITGRSTGGNDGVVRAAESTFSISVFEN
jgi:type IV pilus assembly protein PilX